MAHSSSLLVVASLFALCAACSGEVKSVPADMSDAGTGGTTATGGSGGGTGGTGGTDVGGSGGSGGAVDGGSGGGSGGSGGAVDGGVAGSGGAPIPDQEIVFEVSYENYAWGAQLNGIFITSDGSVYEYDAFAGDAGGMPPPASQHATEPELRARWGTVTGPVAQIPVAEVAARFAVVESVARGVLLSSYLCADAGELTYLGYLYDSPSETYSRVVAGIDGDRAAKNLADGADELVSWLASIHGGGGSCTFMAAQCTGEVCDSIPPTCSPGFVPSVENGCWGSCVQVTRCLEVPDCSWCGDNVCATSESGTKHCTPGMCSGLGPCACGYSPCGGGADFCSEESGVAVTCGVP